MAFRAARETEDLARLYAEHSRPLLQLAALLVSDIGAAREIVYEAFAAFDRRRSRPRRSEDVFMLLLRAVVRRAREIVPEPRAVRAEPAVMGALHALPARQREALVLRYYGQLSDEQAATVIGVRPAGLRADIALGLAGLRAALATPGL